jgi:hypothetical protein
MIDHITTRGETVEAARRRYKSRDAWLLAVKGAHVDGSLCPVPQPSSTIHVARDAALVGLSQAFAAPSQPIDNTSATGCSRTVADHALDRSHLPGCRCRCHCRRCRRSGILFMCAVQLLLVQSIGTYACLNRIVSPSFRESITTTRSLVQMLLGGNSPPIDSKRSAAAQKYGSMSWSRPRRPASSAGCVGNVPRR